MSGQACSIVYNRNVHMERKRFSRSQWVFRSMNVSQTQYDLMYNFCKAHVGEPFNKLGYFLAWTPLLAPSPSFYTWLGMSHRWYCSEIVVAALKAGACCRPPTPVGAPEHAVLRHAQTVHRGHGSPSGRGADIVRPDSCAPIMDPTAKRTSTAKSPTCAGSAPSMSP